MKEKEEAEEIKCNNFYILVSIGRARMVQQFRRSWIGGVEEVVSYRRTTLMILKDQNTELDVNFKIKVDGFTYLVFAQSGLLKCFRCGAVGHLINRCPEAGSSSDGKATASRTWSKVLATGTLGPAALPRRQA